jgi:hypothetical protein
MSLRSKPLSAALKKAKVKIDPDSRDAAAEPFPHPLGLT